MNKDLNWWFIFYELILVSWLIAYWIWTIGNPVSEISSSTFPEAIIGLIPLAIAILMIAPFFISIKK